MEMGVLLKRLRSGGVRGFEFARPDRGAGGGDEFGQIGDVVVVSVGEEDGADAELLGGDEAKHIVTVSAGVEDGGFFGAGIPNEVAVDRHVLEWGVEHGEAPFKKRLLGIPRTMGEGLEGVGRKPKVTGDAADDQDVDHATLDGGELRQGDLSAGGELGVGDFHSALGFVDDVVEIIFERDAGHRFETLRWRKERAS